MNFRRWVVFTFLIHFLVIAVDKGGGLVLYLLTRNRADQHGSSGIVASLPFILMAVANLGLATSLVYFVRRRRYTAQQAFETTATVALVWGGGVALLAGVVILAVLPCFGPAWSFDPFWVVPTCIAVPLLLLSSYGNSVQLASDRVGDYGAVHLASSLVFLPAFFLVFFLLGGRVADGDVPRAVAWGRMITATLMALLVLVLVGRVVRLRLRVHRPFLRDSLRFGWRANVTSTLTYLNHRLDLLVLGAIYAVPGADPEAAQVIALGQVAYYSMAVTWAELVWHFPEAMRDLFFSKVAGSTHDEARRLTPVLSRLGLTVSVIGGAVVLLLLDPVMGSITNLVQRVDNPWYESWSQPVGQALLLLTPGTMAFTVSKVLQADLAARNRLQTCVNAQVLVLVVMLALDVLLMPTQGAAGAAIASSVAYGVSTVYTVIAYCRQTGTPVRECLLVHRADFRYIREIVSGIWRKLRGWRA